MKNEITQYLQQLKDSGNYRLLPADSNGSGILDFSSNDYLGLAEELNLRKEFLETIRREEIPSFSTSASRLLASRQKEFSELESLLESIYKRPALIFNSGYHANTGILGVLASIGKTLIIADKLIHASIIDGLMLSRSEFIRFRHNDTEQLTDIIRKNYDKFSQIIIVTESVFSMDGDRAPLEDLLQIKREHEKVFLYLDEAHAFGVKGPLGSGYAQTTSQPQEWDIIVGTFGKAAASMGAFVIIEPEVKELLINRSRSLIFSTALPPIQIKWTTFILKQMMRMDSRRLHLENLSRELSTILTKYSMDENKLNSHIQSLIIGNSKETLRVSAELMKRGIKAMAIRRPTVPPGTERIRISLSANMSSNDLEVLDNAIGEIYAGKVYKA